MKLFIDPNLLSISSIESLNKLFGNVKDDEGNPIADFKSLDESNGYYNIDDITKTDSHVDKVKDFVELYIKYSDGKLLKGRVDYIVNRLYAAKGYSEIFRVIEQELGLTVVPGFTGSFITSLHYGDVESNHFDEINTSLVTALYYLILIGDIRSFVDTLTLNISENIEVYNSISFDDYQKMNFT